MNKSTFNFASVLILAICILLSAICNSPAASPGTTWDTVNQFGNPGNDSAFSGQGQSFAVVTSVQSNSVYYISGANVSANVRLLSVLAKTEATAGTFKFYVATNQYVCASNQVPAGTNIIWLSSTNAGLATNDLLVYQNKANGLDSYQMTILSGNATDAAGLVFTNAAGYCAIKIFAGLTNAIAAGDIIYQMRPIFSSIPLQESIITNGVATPWTSWLPIINNVGSGASVNGGGYGAWFSGRIGVPTLSVLTVSNTGSLFVSGDYYRRTR